MNLLSTSSMHAPVATRGAPAITSTGAGVLTVDAVLDMAAERFGWPAPDPLPAFGGVALYADPHMPNGWMLVKQGDRAPFLFRASR